MATEPAVLQQRLAEAEAAYHKLMTGSSRVSVSYDGTSVTYERAQAEKLAAYIEDLKRQLGIRRRPRARRVVFG